MYDSSRIQWTMTVTVYHGPKFGHAVEVATETRGRPRETLNVPIGSWRGVGLPKEVYRGILASVDAILGDYLVHRYGVQESLEAWPDEVDPY